MKSSKVQLIMALALALFLGSAKLAEASLILYAANRGPDGTLYTLDLTTGTATAVGTGTGFKSISAMDFHPTTGVLYAEASRPSGSNRVLISIDPTTGVGTEVADIPDSHSFGSDYSGLSFRSDGTLFAYLEAGDGLGTLTLGGVLTELGSTGVSCCGNGIAFDASDVLYHANNVALHTLNQTSGVATLIASLSGPGIINAMDFNPDTGVLFATTDSDLLTTVSLGGVVTSIGPTGIDMGAIAFLPEPSTALLLASGLCGLAFRRRSRLI